MRDFLGFLQSLSHEAEFWSAIVGAIVGGAIALLAQLVALRAAKNQRNEDRLSIQRALAYSLLFKMVRIHGNLYGIHHHIEACYEKAKESREQGNPWQFYVPLANPPESVVFSPDEMGMLFSLKDDEVFNSVLDLDVAHNSLVKVVELITSSRRELTRSLKVSSVDGVKLAGVFNDQELLALRPQMIEVDSLIESARTQATTDYKASLEAVEKLNSSLRKKLGLTSKIELLKKM